MVGVAFEDPFCFSKNSETEYTRSDYMNLLNLHLDEFDKFSTEENPRKFDPPKKVFQDLTLEILRELAIYEQN